MSEALLYEVKNGVAWITFNTPKKKNAMSIEMYPLVTALMKKAEADDNVKVVAFIGNGDYFSSGNDLTNFMRVDMSDTTAVKKFIEGIVVTLRDFVEGFITYPKLLVACVNGPAIGIGCSILGLFDFVYCSDKFVIFINGQSPEACSSYTFPKIMGQALASEFVIQGRQFSAQDAMHAKLVARVFPNEDLLKKVQEITTELAELPPTSCKIAKRLLRSEEEIQVLKRINLKEVDILAERWTSPECFQAIVTFLSKPKKAKL